MKPLTIAITGAAGNIGYALTFWIASGALGASVPIVLRLIEPLQNLLDGLEMEIEDGCFPNLEDLVVTTDPREGFKDADAIFLVGARPRSKGMERKDLLYANAPIFQQQGQALDGNVGAGAKILVVGNPANTNALILQTNAPSLNPKQVTCMTQLDHNRARVVLGKQLGVNFSEIRRMIIWGNHSSTQFPDCSFCTSGDAPVSGLADDWKKDVFVPFVQQRGTQVINTRGASSAASAATAAIMHMQTWMSSTKKRDWVSMGVRSNGNNYQIEEDIYFSFPVTVAKQQTTSEWYIQNGLPISPYQRKMLKNSEKELCKERDAIERFL